MCLELLVGKINGLLLRDKGFIHPKLKQELAELGTYLETPLRDNMSDERPKNSIKWLRSTRRLIETVIGQLSEQFHRENVRARNLLHQACRFWRK